MYVVALQAVEELKTRIFNLQLVIAEIDIEARTCNCFSSAPSKRF